MTPAVLDNPLPKLTDQRREDRLYGWLVSVLARLPQECWLLYQELWMIDGLVWNELSPGDLKRDCARDLMDAWVEWPNLHADNFQEGLTGAREAMALCTGLLKGPEHDFRDERALLPRLIACQQLFRVLVEEADRSPGEGLVGRWQRLAEQELSLPLQSILSFPPLSMAPPRQTKAPRADELARRWGEIAGWVDVATLPYDEELLDPALPSGGMFLCETPQQLDAYLWDDFANFLSVPVDQADPVTAWFLDVVGWAHREMLVLLPALMRHEANAVVQRRDAGYELGAALSLQSVIGRFLKGASLPAAEGFEAGKAEALARYEAVRFETE